MAKGFIIYTHCYAIFIYLNLKIMKETKKNKKYRYCKHCDRSIPIEYNLNEHIKICKNIWKMKS